MSYTVTVFQFEIRYQHILNFSQIARKVLSPYVRLAQSINLENQNTVNERVILNFEDEDYTIIANWDRILIKAQGETKKYTAKNSPIEAPFFSMLEHIRKLEEFGSITSVLFAMNAIKKLDKKEEDLVDHVIEKAVSNEASKILDNTTDLALQLTDKKSGLEQSVTFGPYFGEHELTKRAIIPVNIESLGDIDFFGGMVEYKYFETRKDVSFTDFEKIVKEAESSIEKVWKIL